MNTDRTTAYLSLKDSVPGRIRYGSLKSSHRWSLRH
jgi:hypothetical protein